MYNGDGKRNKTTGELTIQPACIEDNPYHDTTKYLKEYVFDTQQCKGHEFKGKYFSSLFILPI